MSRITICLFPGFLLLGIGSVQSTAEDHQPSNTKAMPVAPFPHQPGEWEFLNNDDMRFNLKSAIPELEDPKQNKSITFSKLRDPKPDDPPAEELAVPYAWRTGETIKKLRRAGGCNEESERSVALGLAWLARQQKMNGSWVYEAGEKAEVTAATGMALLAFLGAGQTHLPNSKYSKTVRAGLNWMLTDLNEKNLDAEMIKAGKFMSTGNLYAQAIGTIALCEAYGMTKDKQLLAPAQAAINYIQRGQGLNGSWGYQPNTNGDTSIVGWQIQALRAAILSKDIIVADTGIKRAIRFLDTAGAGFRKSAYGYLDNAGAAPGTSLTAVGLLSRYYIDGWGPDNAGMAEGVAGLMKRAPGPGAKPPLDMYFYYYATQVVHFFEGDEWKTWNEGPKQPDGSRKGGMRNWLIELQFKKDGKDLGSWDPDAGFIGRDCGRLGTTAMCILTLEVYYRHLPLHKRDIPDEKKDK